MELLLAFFTLLVVIFICRKFEVNSFSVCWFLGFSYIAAQNTQTRENIKLSALISLTVILTALLSLPLVKRALRKRENRPYELLFAVGIEISVMAMVLLEEKLLKFL